MTRKLALLLTVCLGFWHGAAHALGLGDIEVDSALNQRFEARIELRNTEALGPNEIIAGLASSEDFARVGVERFFFLSDLQFSTDLSDPAGPSIVVSSSQPITEPFVNFVVEVMWPSGRLLREYTVLLDPATYAAGPASPAGALPSAGPGAGPAAGDGGAGRPAPDRPASGAAPAAPARAAPESSGRGEFNGSSYGVTDREDTLWEVALTVRPEESLSVQQTMLALVRNNPEAFIGGNINQLKAGYVLRVPDSAEIRRLSFDDAVMQVAQQNDRWRQGLDRAPLDARASTGSGGPGTSSTAGELRLVAAEDTAAAAAEQGSARGSAGSVADDGGAEGASAAELAEARASAEALRDQLAATEERAAELARELELKNEQLARAQQVLAQQMNEPSAPAPQATPSGGPFGLSWLVIAAGLAALIVAAAAVLLVLRRRGEDDEPIGALRQRSFGDARPQIEPTLGLADVGSDSDASTAAPGDASEEAEDVIGEADVYMVYGRFSEAARVLNAAIDQDPDRADIRLKLLEVYVESGDVDGFNVQAQALSAFADYETIALADQLATRLPGAMSSSGDVTDGFVSSGPAADAADGEVSLDFDLASAEHGAPLDLDSLDIDLDMDEQPGEGRAQDRPSIDGPDPDFDLDVSGEDEADLAADGDLPDIDYALDLDDPDAPAAAPAASDATGAGREEEDDIFGEVEFDGLDGQSEDAVASTGAEGDSRVNDDGFAKTQLLDSAEIQRALAEEDAAPAHAGAADRGSDAPTDELSGDEFAFDLDDLGTDSDAEDGAREQTASPDAALDDLADAPAADASHDDAARVADAGSHEAGLTGHDDAAAAGTDRPVLATAEGDLDFDLDGDEFDFNSAEEGDEISTKLELARAYVDMGDEDGAREILGEVVRDGDDTQKQEAGNLLQQLG